MGLGMLLQSTVGVCFTLIARPEKGEMQEDKGVKTAEGLGGVNVRCVGPWTGEALQGSSQGRLPEENSSGRAAEWLFSASKSEPALAPTCPGTRLPCPAVRMQRC